MSDGPGVGEGVAVMDPPVVPVIEPLPEPKTEDALPEESPVDESVSDSESPDHKAESGAIDDSLPRELHEPPEEDTEKDETSKPKIKEISFSSDQLKIELAKASIFVFKSESKKIDSDVKNKSQDELTDFFEKNPQKKLLRVLSAVSYGGPRNLDQDTDHGFIVNLKDPDLPTTSKVRVVRISKINEDNTVTCYRSTPDGTGIDTTEEGVITLTRKRLTEMLLLSGSEGLLGKDSILRDEEKEIIGGYIRSINEEDFSDSDQNNKLAKNIENLVSKSGGIVSRDIVQYVEDEALADEVTSRLIIDDASIIRRLLGATPEKQAKLLEHFKELAKNVNSQEELELYKKLQSNSERFVEGLNTSDSSLDSLLIEIFNGSGPDWLGNIRSVIKSGNFDGAGRKVLEEFFSETQIGQFEAFMKKHGKTIGKVSLIAALGLMYALMKSGKEQPQYQ
ncbi:MAG: hypothetical protein WEC80_02835 [Patescibacteria group bacterium]